MYNRKAVMIYSTLKEAYSVDSFEKDRKSSKPRRKIKYEEVEDFGNEPESPRTSSEKSVKTTSAASAASAVPTVNTVPTTQNVHSFPQTQTNIQPYYDEELEKYLNINDFKNISETQYIPQNFRQNSMQNQQNQTQSSQQYQPVTQTRPFYTSQQIPIQQTQPVQQAQSVQQTQAVQQTQPVQQIPIQQTQPVQQIPIQQTQPVQQAQSVQPIQQTRSFVSESSSKKDVFYKNLINIGLFALIGILIIFLCDQITEIAINIGMKKTVFILEPFLQELQLRKDRLQTD
jgi:hypothetical protein